MKTQREARRDAEEYARAQMYYGEGAGIRRRLIMTAVNAKVHRDPVYARAFHTELSQQDMADHAFKARREREKTDRNEAVRRNARALLTGNHKNAQTGILILILAGTAVHKTGFDKVVYEKSKVVYGKAKLRIKKYRQKLHSVN